MPRITRPRSMTRNDSLPLPSPVDFQGVIVPGAVTGCVLDAVFLRLMEHVSEGHLLRRCRNSRCRKAFIPDRTDQFYCGRTCQNLANRYRQLGKSIDVEEVAKGRNHA